MDTFIQAFPTCPIVYGKNGCKIMFFLSKQPKTNFALLTDESKNPAGEFYSSGTNRLCFVYGKHPNTLKDPESSNTLQP